MQLRVQRSKTQKLALKLLNEPEITDLLFGGGAGGGKSLLVCLWAVLECRNYPGIRIGLGRKEITRLKQTTVVTLMREAHKLLNVKEGEFTYQDHKALITYINGSSIQLVDLARQPSDPDCDRFGSLNFTHVIIEEVGEVGRKERDVLISRKNRFMNQEHNLVGKSVSTCNPSQNYIKAEYYKPYKNLGAGEWQKWPYGEVEIDGVMHTAYRAFIRSLASDNPFLPRNYIEVLRKLPDAERKRLLEGNWDYEDDDAKLFKAITLDRSVIDTIESGQKFIGVDVADVGSDKTIFSLVEGKTLVEQRNIEVEKTEAVGEQIAMEIIKYAQQNGMDHNQARRIGIDTLGVGASTRDFMRSKGWYVSEFIAGASVEDIIFKNLRGQTIYHLAQAMDKGEFKLYSRLETMDVLREQFMAHEYYTEERKILIKPKKDVKETLGVSPDYFESAYIAYWVSQGNKDPRMNSARIVF